MSSLLYQSKFFLRLKPQFKFTIETLVYKWRDFVLENARPGEGGLLWQVDASLHQVKSTVPEVTELGNLEKTQSSYYNSVIK